jgi:hypothetical protein
MRKILIISAFLLATITVQLWVVVLTIESHRATIDRIAPSTQELREKAEKMGPLRLTENEVKDLCMQLNRELIHLANLKWVFASTIILILTLTLWGLSKFNFNATRFDGLCLLGVTLLLFGFHSLVYEFSGGFHGGHSASMDIRIAILIGTFIVPPVLFYIAYRMNKIELGRSLHNQKWISYMAIALTTLSLLLALIVGIGILFTPDLSGNIT